MPWVYLLYSRRQQKSTDGHFFVGVLLMVEDPTVEEREGGWGGCEGAVSVWRDEVEAERLNGLFWRNCERREEGDDDDDDEDDDDVEEEEEG